MTGATTFATEIGPQLPKCSVEIVAVDSLQIVQIVRPDAPFGAELRGQNP